MTTTPRPQASARYLIGPGYPGRGHPRVRAGATRGRTCPWPAPTLLARGDSTVLIVTDPFHEARSLAIATVGRAAPLPDAGPDTHPSPGASTIPYYAKETVGRGGGPDHRIRSVEFAAHLVRFVGGLRAVGRNVLFITVDQWRGDCLSAVGHPVVTTPALDRLAAQGALFANHWANAAPCGPSRACLYTGTYLHHNRSVLNGTPLDARFTNVALLARQAGYDPVLFGYTDTSLDPRTLPADDPRLRSLRAGAAGLPSGGLRSVGGRQSGLGPVAGRPGGRRPARRQRALPSRRRLPGCRPPWIDVGTDPVRRRALPVGLPDRLVDRMAGPPRGGSVLRPRLVPPAPSPEAQPGRVPRPL